MRDVRLEDLLYGCWSLVVFSYDKAGILRLSDRRSIGALHLQVNRWRANRIAQKVQFHGGLPWSYTLNSGAVTLGGIAACCETVPAGSYNPTCHWLMAHPLCALLTDSEH